MSLVLVPLTLREANAFVLQHHRTHGLVRGCLFCIGAVEVGDEAICAVAIVGRPVARRADNGWTAEVTRMCSDGTDNVCSFLYAAAWRAAKAMGYTKLITYTQTFERGGSLRGAGWVVVGASQGGSWSRTSRPRVDLHPMQEKLRWEAR